MENKLYDDKSKRKWHHLDLWQYKTFIYCNFPRYKDAHDKVKIIDIPWAEPKPSRNKYLNRNRYLKTMRIFFRDSLLFFLLIESANTKYLLYTEI